MHISTCQTLTTLQSESVESLYFVNDDEINKKYKGATGGVRTWLTEGMTAGLPDFVTLEVRSSRDAWGFQICLRGTGP
jgi:hypothetical protein